MIIFVVDTMKSMVGPVNGFNTVRLTALHYSSSTFVLDLTTYQNHSDEAERKLDICRRMRRKGV
jgi:hypothetical protein